MTYKLSEDLLEMFFGSVSQYGEWNTKPSAYQFFTAYTALLSHAELSAMSQSHTN